MKKAAKLNFLFGTILSGLSALSIIGTALTFLSLGTITALVFIIISCCMSWFWSYTLEIALPIFVYCLTLGLSILSALLPILIIFVLNIIGMTKVGTKKPLNIIQLVIGGLTLVNGMSLPALFLVEGAIFGLCANTEEKEKQKQEAEAQVEVLEELEERM